MGSVNYPFYVDLKKPAPSLSKHDDERPTYYRYQDAQFILLCWNGGVETLLDEIRFLRRELADVRKEVNESGAW